MVYTGYMAKANAILFFDTETTGLPRSWRAPVTDVANWPRLVQLAWILYEESGRELSQGSYIIKPDGFTIPKEVAAIHGISTERALREGESILAVLNAFQSEMQRSVCLVAHNMSFDEMVIGAEFLRNKLPNPVIAKKRICTKEATTNFCAIPSPNGYGDYKWPKLAELHAKLFGCDFEGAHNAIADVAATAKCYWQLKKLGVL